MVCIQIHPRKHEAKLSALRTISSSLYCQQVGLFVDKQRTESNLTLLICNPALQGTIHDLMNLKQKLEQTRKFR